MESYPDPTLPSRPPGYPYFLDSVVASESQPQYQNGNFAAPQFNTTSENQEQNLEGDAGRAEAYEDLPGALRQPFGTSDHSFRTSGAITGAQIIPASALPLPKKCRQLALEDAPSKRQNFPVVGVFKPPQLTVPRARSPLTAIKNTRNANINAKNREDAYSKYKNTLATIVPAKSTVFYKENRQGKLVIQKYSHQRTGRVTTVPDKQETFAPLHKPASAPQHCGRPIPSHALPCSAASNSLSTHEKTSNNYLHDLYCAFKRDFEDTALPRANYPVETINPQDLTMKNHEDERKEEMEYYFDSPAPPPSFQTQNIIQQPKAQEAQSKAEGVQHVAMAHIIRKDEARGLATRATFDAAFSPPALTYNGNGHGVREFVELMNHEGRDDINHKDDVAMTLSRFADPPLAERENMDGISEESRALPTSFGGSSKFPGAFVHFPSATGESGADEMDKNSTRSPSPIFPQDQSGNTNPFTFAVSENLTYAQLSSPHCGTDEI